MAKDGLTNAERVEKLPWALAADFANIVHYYLTFAPTILLLFFDKLGLGKSRMGVLLAIVTLVDLLTLAIMPIVGRYGYKRVFLIFWVARKVAIAGMIAAPLVPEAWGVNARFAFAISVIGLFSLCRTIAVAAYSPWAQEFVPATIRGKYSAVQNIVVGIAGIATTFAMGRWLGESPEINKFIALFAVALVFGLIGAGLYSRVPGGEPEAPVGPAKSGMGWRDGFDSIRLAARDRNLWIFEAGSACITVGWGLMGGFLSLFYKDRAGLMPDQIFYLDSILLIAGLVSCFPWGWAADRYGSKPVMMLNLVMLVIYPLGLLFLPLKSPITYMLVVGLVVLVGLVNAGWSIGYNRYYSVNLLPKSNRDGYIAIHIAVVGLLSSVTQLATGRILDATAGIHGRLGPISLTPWTLTFITAIVGVSAGAYLLGKLPSSGALPVSRFAAMFFQGNPITAAQALIAYEVGGPESRRLAAIERLGHTRSPFSVDEMIEGLHDPSFNVRYEAIVSIARTSANPRLTQALVGMLEGDELELAPAAAWALGRIKDQSAIPALRNALTSPYPSVRTRSARALAMLSDRESATRIMSVFESERDANIRLAYASALGSMSHEPALGSMLAMLRELSVERQRREMALAIATILGEDERAVRLWRRMNSDAGDALAGVVLGLRRRVPLLVPGLPANVQTLHHVIDRCARAFGNQDLQRGAAELRVLAAAVEISALTSAAGTVLWDSISGLDEFGHSRSEYVTLCVHTLHVGIRPDAVS